MITRIRNTQQRQNFGISEENIRKSSTSVVKYGRDVIETPQTNTSNTLLEAYLRAQANSKSAGDFLCLLTLGTHK